jgi:hypothetical protein
MPGNTFAPEQQNQAERWMRLGGENPADLLKGVTRVLYGAVGDPTSLGRVAIGVGAHKGVKVGGTVPLQYIKRVLDRANGWGYGIIGEAIMQKFDMHGRLPEYSGRFGGLKKMARRVVASRIPDIQYGIA